MWGTLNIQPGGHLVNCKVTSDLDGQRGVGSSPSGDQGVETSALIGTFLWGGKFST